MTVSVIRDLRDFARYHFDPVQDVTRFIRDCRNSGMKKRRLSKKWKINYNTVRQRRNSSSMSSGTRQRKRCHIRLCKPFDFPVQITVLPGGNVKSNP